MPDRCLLYYITDRSQFPGDEPARRQALLTKVAEAASAGVDYIQLREKDLSARALEKLATDVVAAIRESSPPRTENQEPRTENREPRTKNQEPRTENQELRTENRELRTDRTRLLINSRTDIALAAAADGVHLRADDIAPHEARQVQEVSAHRPLPTAHFLVAVSCHSKEEVNRAQSEAADFAVFAPVFGKSSGISNPGSPPAGLAALREACQANIPVIALGGITLENAASCLQAGAAGVAAIRLFQQNKIEEVVRHLRAL
jgi:thiamine-phosphate pyrophosphorylase